MPREPGSFSLSGSLASGPSNPSSAIATRHLSTQHLSPPLICAILALVMTAWPSVLHSAELGDLTEDVRRLLQELGATTSASRSTAAGDCVPPLDVIETDEAVEILLDVPGVTASSLRVLLKGSVVLIAGEKWVTGPGPGTGGYHLVERGSGRFARAVRVSGAFEGSRVRATLTDGELRITAAEAGRSPRHGSGRAHRIDSPRMKLLFVGDIVGRPGRDLVRVGLAPLVACHAIDLVIVNGENAAGGNGITREIGDSLFAQGVDVITSGNHIWDKREALDYIKIEPRLLRPANYPDAPGPRQLRRADAEWPIGGRAQRDGPGAPGQHRRPVSDRAPRDRAPCASARRSSLSTSTPRPRPRRSPWAGSSTARSRRSSARTRTCRPPMAACCRAARRT